MYDCCRKTSHTRKTRLVLVLSRPRSTLRLQHVRLLLAGHPCPDAIVPFAVNVQRPRSSGHVEKPRCYTLRFTPRLGLFVVWVGNDCGAVGGRGPRQRHGTNNLPRPPATLRRRERQEEVSAA